MERPNLILANTRTTAKYESPQQGGGSDAPVYPRERLRHAAKLIGRLAEAYQSEQALREVGKVTRSGTYLDFRGPADGNLAALSLENQQQDVRLLNIRQEEAQPVSVGD